jgi:DnaJ-class molecular chaperone
VHPDKNSHPGATEAFKRLKDAYQRLAKGEEKTAAVLAVSVPAQKKDPEKPPKVISVKTQM